MMAAREPLLSGAPEVHALQGRFLSEAFYREKLAGFRKYDPSLWRPTLHIHMSSFMTVPLSLLVGWTLSLTSNAAPGSTS